VGYFETFKYDRYNSVVSEGTASHYYPGEDDLANTAGLVISFHHVPSSKSVSFKAYITAYNETYAPDWAAETVYGRADPIYLYKNTTRKITLSFKIPAISAGNAYENLARVQELIQYLYPTYTDTDNANTISQSPLIRLKVMNLARDPSTVGADVGGLPFAETYESYHKLSADNTKYGLLGVINNLTVNHNLESDAGVIEMPNTILPKLIEINLDFSPIHEHTVGWLMNPDIQDLDFAERGFPYMAIPGAEPSSVDVPEGYGEARDELFGLTGEDLASDWSDQPRSDEEKAQDDAAQEELMAAAAAASAEADNKEAQENVKEMFEEMEAEGWFGLEY